MTELTKEHFDERLTEVQKSLTDQNEELARIVKDGFDGVDRQLAGIVQMLDVRKDVEELKHNVQEIRHALNLER